MKATESGETTDREETLVVEEIRRQAHALWDRELQLWSVNILLLLVVAAAFVASMWPQVVWNIGSPPVDTRYGRPLFFGFFMLVVLFGTHASVQRRVLRRRREELLNRFIRTETVQKGFIIDPLTKVSSRGYLDQLLAKEVGRADRGGTSLTFLMIDVDAFKSVNKRYGDRVGDRLLMAVGQLLTGTFRGMDTVIRYGGDEFLVVMPETNEAQAQRALERLMMRVDDWNRGNPIPGCRLSLSCGLAAFAKGASITHALEAAEQRMNLQKNARRTVR